MDTFDPIAMLKLGARENGAHIAEAVFRIQPRHVWTSEEIERAKTTLAPFIGVSIPPLVLSDRVLFGFYETDLWEAYRERMQDLSAEAQQ